ncbi:MAG: hypothetical protein HY901_16070 [Deltaproteobacteria bacterium]|nr:hypothetical protein [Deltaproteobacteria bacterium]
MHRIELTALRSSALRWEQLVSELPPALESLGLVHDDAATDGTAVVLDHGTDGCTILFENVALSRRAARALATRTGVPIALFEVVGTAGTKRFRFRTTAWRATAVGEMLGAEGVELDLEDPEESWGGGPLEVQANRVLDLYAELNRRGSRTLELGYRRRPRARASTPRVATLLAMLQKAKSFEAQPQADGRVALKIELATGGKQTSFCSAVEHEELEKLLS